MIELNDYIFNAVQEAQVLDFVDGKVVKTGEKSETSYGDVCRRQETLEQNYSWKKNTVDKGVSADV